MAHSLAIRVGIYGFEKIQEGSRDTGMNKYIYHGGKSTEEGLATISVAKIPGTDRYDVQLDFSSPAAAMDAL